MLRFKILQEFSQNMEKPNFKTRPLFFGCSFLGFLLILLSTICVCSAVESDFYYLKSIKDSLPDPFNSLGSWDFRNAIEGSVCHFGGIQCWHDYDNKVMNLRLSNLGLIGEFPGGIQNCTSLTGLDLSSNKLYGTIPSDISVIVEHVTKLDLASNLFSGNIPPAIANCAYLNFLMLDNNNLRGEIPSRIGSLPRVKIFIVANNYLTKSVPSFVNIQITTDSFANNSRLCGKPWKECDYSEDFRDSWIWKHIDYASFIQAFVVSLVFFYALVIVFCLFQFPTKAINKIVSLNKWKLRRKEHLSPRSDSPGDEELRSH